MIGPNSTSGSHTRWRDFLLAIVTLGASATCTDSDSPVTSLPVTEYRIAERLKDDGLLHEVRDMKMGSDGDLWVLSGSEPFVYRFVRTRDSAGPPMRLAERFLAHGRGPKEAFGPQAFLLSSDRAPVQVWDPGNRKRISLAPGGRIGEPLPFDVPGVGSTRSDIREITYGEPFKILRVNGRLLMGLYPRGLLRTGDYRHGELVEVDDTGAVVRRLVDFRSLGRDGAYETGSDLELVDIPLWHVCGDRLVVFDPSTPALRWYDSAGVEQHATALELPRRKLKPVHIRAFLARMVRLELAGTAYDEEDVERQVDAMVERQRHLFPSGQPLAVKLLCDATGRPWLQQFNLEDESPGFGGAWLVADAERGIHEVRFPAGFEPYLLMDHEVWGVDRDSLGVERIARAVPVSE